MINEIARLTNQSNWTTELCRRAQVERDMHKDNIEAARQYLLENRYDMPEHAEALADLLGVKLTRTYDVAVTVTFTTQVEIDEEIGNDDIEYNLLPEFNLDLGNTEGSDYSIDLIQIDEAN